MTQPTGTQASGAGPTGPVSLGVSVVGDEIASVLKLPDALAKQWYNRPYYV